MRKELFFNPFILVERLGQWSNERRRLWKLKGTCAQHLSHGHIDSLELLELLRPVEIKIIYDIGANVGTWTLLAKAIFSKAQVHAFEPLEKHSILFQEKTKSISGVFFHQIA